MQRLNDSDGFEIGDAYCVMRKGAGPDLTHHESRMAAARSLHTRVSMLLH